MQISSEQANRIREGIQQAKRQNVEQPVESVEELAAKHGVKMDEVRRVTERAMMAEDDPARERRVAELARRVAEGSYNVEADELLDMAERRAIADRSGRI
jgi:anti-sigma28 factor (negative regulator of flagellin synthesis)